MRARRKRWRLARLLIAFGAFLSALAPGVSAAAAASPASGPKVLVAFLPIAEQPAALDSDPEPALAFRPILERLAVRPAPSLGLSSATQGRYSPVQALLDITQGSRSSLSSYSPEEPWPVVMVLEKGGGAYQQGWLETNLRARTAPARVEPGLLAQSVPGGAAYAGVRGRYQRESIVATDRTGEISEVSLGASRDVADRARALLARHRLVVAGLPTGTDGDRALDRLIATRPRDTLLIVMQTPPEVGGAQLLPVGIVGLGGPGELTSSTTHLDGVIAGIDIFPTALDWMGLPVPEGVRGQPVEVQGSRNPAALERLAERLRIVQPRRFPVLWSLLGAWVVLFMAASLVAARPGTRWAMRVGALAVFWLPSVLLLAAAIEPGRLAEIALLVVVTLAAGMLTDYFIPWPRAPALPALVGVLAYVIDLAFGSPLIIGSLLGPNPLFGSRFYGIGNELEATLPALALIGLGAAWFGRGRSRALVAWLVAVGLVLGLAIGAGRLGADVGGVMTVGAGFAVAGLLLWPGTDRRRAVAVVIVVPLVALALLAVVDLVTGGDSHFSRTVLRSDGSGDLLDTFLRRYELAGRVLIRGFMPVATIIAILAIALGVRRRDRLFDTVGSDPAWVASIAGCAAVGIGGAVFNDSGPLLLIIATFVAACGVLYLRGRPVVTGEGER
ncbi:MAG: hypothetical protein ACKOH7_04240 [Solirubrobacterales bacterium]